MRFPIILLVGCVLSTLASAAPPFPPEPIPGSLVIVGGGRMPAPVREEFVRLAGGKENAKIVVIPTASESADKEKEHAAYLKPWQDAGVTAVSLLHTRDIATANSAEFVKPLKSATAVWFSGGNQAKITQAYLGTAVEKELREVLKRGGVVGGTSAGAAVLADLMITGGTDKATTAPGLRVMPGFVIDQHFTERKRLPRLKGVINAHREYVGLGIDEATAVIVRDGRILRFLGEGTVTVVLAKSSTKDEVVQVISAKSPGGLDAFQLLRAAAYRARKTPFPPENPAVPEVKNGSLVIVGGGGAGPEIWKTFIEKAGGNDKLIVVVTSAMEDPVPTNPVEVVLLKRYGATNVKILHTRDRAKANTDEFSAILKEAHGVWFSGGRQWRFVDSYAGTLTETRFKEVLDRGGVIGGSSAGASIQSEYMPRGHPLGNTVMAAEGYEQGFGYLPGCAVDQHFFARKRTEDMTSLMKMYPQLLGIGIDEGTAIVVTGTEAKVIGRTQVAFYDYRTPPKAGSPDYVTVKAGGVYDLKERKAK